MLFNGKGDFRTFADDECLRPIPGRGGEGMPPGTPYNVGQLYYMFGEAIRGQDSRQPDFDTAVELHRQVDAIRLSSEQKQAVTV